MAALGSEHSRVASSVSVTDGVAQWLRGAVTPRGKNSIGDRENRRSLAWRVFFEASTRLQGVIEARLKASAGVSLSDYNVLLVLYEAPERRMRMGELAGRLGFSPSRLSYLVGQLGSAGWVQKLPSQGDGRGFEAQLTEEGIEITETASEIHQETVRELLLDDMTDAHIDMIVEAFGHLEESGLSKPERPSEATSETDKSE